jgi:TolB-like protein/cytochrome c-type biogenesis protein CcmH/NrfG
MTSKPAAASSPHGPVKRYPPGSLPDKLRRRGLARTFAAFAGSGWFLYEIVHFVLVDHYHLPDVLKDITIVTILGALLAVLAWRWFRGERAKRARRWAFIVVPVLAAATLALDVAFLTRWKAHGPDVYAEASQGPAYDASIAVLPFVNIGDDKDQDYFCDGLTEEMITRLSRIRSLKVTARTSAFAFKGDNRDIRDIGRRLGVEKVLEGSVRKDATRVRVSAQLINVADGFHVWSETYDRELGAVLTLQDEIAGAVARELRLTILEPSDPLAQTDSLEAYNEFLLGQHYYVSPTRENLDKAVGHYRRAVAVDPGYARAWAGLGAALAFQANVGFTPTDAGYTEAIAAVRRALGLDDALAYAHVVLGWIHMTYNWDWRASEASFAKALRLDPARGYFGAAQLALVLGRFDRALALARRAVELDALNTSALMNLALTAFYAGRLEESVEVFRRMHDIDPERGNIHALLAQVYLARNRAEEARAALEEEKDPFFRLPVESMIERAMGRERESYEALGTFIDRYGKGNAYQIAQVHAFRGETNLALEWLEIAYKDRDGGLYLTKVDPYFRVLRGDPRFAAFLSKMGFPADAP